jgi:alkylhydroperoxidase family enzyme
MRKQQVALFCLTAIVVTGPTSASVAQVFTPAEIARRDVEINGHAPRMARMPSEADRPRVEGSIPARDRELITLRIAWLCQSPQVWGKHVASAKKEAGLTTPDIERITHGSAAAEWNDRDRAVLKAAEELHENSMIADPTWAALAKQFDQYQLIELPLIIGHVQGGSYLVNALRIPLETGNIGLAAR